MEIDAAALWGRQSCRQAGLRAGFLNSRKAGLKAGLPAGLPAPPRSWRMVHQNLNLTVAVRLRIWPALVIRPYWAELTVVTSPVGFTWFRTLLESTRNSR